MTENRWRCTECDWRGYKLLVAPNPFDTEQSICGCPNCKDVGQFVSACMVDDCKQDASCGTPTPDGYKWLCSTHYAETEKAS